MNIEAQFVTNQLQKIKNLLPENISVTRICDAIHLVKNIRENTSSYDKNLTQITHVLIDLTMFAR
jgi:hypothetical protein